MDIDTYGITFMANRFHTYGAVRVDPEFGREKARER